MKCFFCDIQRDTDDKRIIENNASFSRFDDFPVSPGHAEIIPKKHIESFFDLTKSELMEVYDLILKTKLVIEKKFHPDGYNLGINEGRAGGQIVNHLHIHIIPRYNNDVDDPPGGIRNIIPGTGDYSEKAKKIGREGYLNQ